MSKTLIRVTLSSGTTPKQVDRYLPANYAITGYDAENNWLWVEGEDHAGWTAEDYVIPRLASGLIWAAVVEQPVNDLGGQDPHPKYGSDPAEVNY